MGDNRDDSADSRFAPPVGMGYIPMERIQGKAIVTFWSTDGSASWLLPWTWFSAAVANVASARAQYRTQRSYQLPTLALASRNGARVTVDGAPARWGAVTLGQHVAVAGGGLPTVDAQLGRDAGGALTGIARIAPYAVPGAALTVTPVRFTFAPDGSGQASTQAIVSGPLAGGRVERLTVPLAARWSRRGVTLNPGCTPVSLERLVLSSLRLDPARLTLCPTGAALVEVAGGRLSGGARVSATALHGAIGRTPLRVTTGGATLRLNDQGFALRDVDATLGPAARATRLSAGSIDGRLTTGGVVGRFTGLGGQIANVPLITPPPVRSDP